MGNFVNAHNYLEFVKYLVLKDIRFVLNFNTRLITKLYAIRVSNYLKGNYSTNQG